MQFRSFDSFDSRAFLGEYWQRQPLLIRNPWQHWAVPLDGDELAGLACEEGVEARLILQGPDGWQLEHGPFAPARFGQLGAVPWSLLVQAVDQHVPEVAAVVEPFRFIPDWRIDDVMISYASDGGGVGPHFDQYDVFLIQGAGRRRWQVGQLCDAQTPLLPHDDLRLLAQFEPVQEWLLEPGDILYLPPGLAHNGIAVGDDCMTLSVGFRAPARGELLARWCDEALADEPGELRYGDPGLERQANPGEITPQALAELHRLALEPLQDRAAFARWFGRYNTMSKYPEIDWSPPEPLELAEVRIMIAAGLPLCRNPASRLAFVRGEDDGIVLFADGEEFPCTGSAARLAEALCAAGSQPVDPQLAGDLACAELVCALCNQGTLAFDEDG